jgi:hypothetical protein
MESRWQSTVRAAWITGAVHVGIVGLGWAGGFAFHDGGNLVAVVALLCLPAFLLGGLTLAFLTSLLRLVSPEWLEFAIYAAGNVAGWALVVYAISRAAAHGRHHTPAT